MCNSRKHGLTNWHVWESNLVLEWTKKKWKWRYKYFKWVYLVIKRGAVPFIILPKSVKKTFYFSKKSIKTYIKFKVMKIHSNNNIIPHQRVILIIGKSHIQFKTIIPFTKSIYWVLWSIYYIIQSISYLFIILHNFM